MPEFISVYGDVLFAELVSGSFPDSLVLLLPEYIRLIGVLQCLSGAFMSGQVIFFSVAFGADLMDVGRELTALSRYLL